MTPAIHNAEAEQAILGAILLDNAVYWQVSERLAADVFYEPRHQVMYEAMGRLAHRSEAIDLVSLSDELRRGPRSAVAKDSAYLTATAMSVATVTAVQTHAKLVVECAEVRQIQRACQDALAAIERLQDNRLVAADTARKFLTSLLTKTRTSIEPLAKVMETVLAQIDDAAKHHGKVQGIPSGFRTLDNYTNGFAPGESIVLSARTGMGKTAVALHFAQAAARAGSAVGLLSLEMSNLQVGLRVLAGHSGVEHWKLRTGRLAPEQWRGVVQSASSASAWPIYLAEMTRATMTDVETTARAMRLQAGISLLIVDNLNLVQGAHEYKTMSENSMRIKLLARALGIPVIALHQLKREVDARDDDARRPRLADLKMSGQIENDADVVLFLYRESYYSKVESDADPVELEVAKYRSGPMGTVPLVWHPRTMTFTEPSRDEPEATQPDEEAY